MSNGNYTQPGKATVEEVGRNIAYGAIPQFNGISDGLFDWMKRQDSNRDGILDGKDDAAIGMYRFDGKLHIETLRGMFQNAWLSVVREHDMDGNGRLSEVELESLNRGLQRIYQHGGNISNPEAFLLSIAQTYEVTNQSVLGTLTAVLEAGSPQYDNVRIGR